MPFFIALFIVVFGLMNAYAFRKLFFGSRFAGWRRRSAVVVAVCALALSPILGPLLHYAGWGRSAAVTAMAGYWWLAIVFWIICVGLLLDAWNFVIRVLLRRSPGCVGAGLSLPRRRQRGIIIITVGVLIAWGLVEGRILVIRTIHLATEKMPAGNEPLRIVHLTDCHFGLTQGRRVKRRILSRVAALEPHMLLCTGDVFDVVVDRPREYVDAFAPVQPPLGKFMVTGNHEFYAGIDDALELFHACGFVTLRESSVPIDGWLRIAGVDDPAGKRMGDAVAYTDDAVALRDASEDEYVILLKHQPTVNHATAHQVDLQLSGHTHGGQIFPFHLFVRMVYHRISGLHSNGGGGLIYVSRGTGNWGPPMRVLAPREITLFVIAPAGGQ